MPTELRQNGRIAEFKTPAKADEFALMKFEAEEYISELFEFRVRASSSTEDADLTKIIGEHCSIRFMRRNGEFRYFSGILAEAEWVAHEHDLHIYKFRLRVRSETHDARAMRRMRTIAAAA